MCSKPLDETPLFPAQSGPHMESTIRVIANHSPKDAHKPLDHGSSTQHKFQPPNEATIRVRDQDSANLVDKVFTKGAVLIEIQDWAWKGPRETPRNPPR
ncbi:alanine--glyoxylate aminotransferase family protein [Sesbania bispinosa]|nr:alanine--glyoxylate aminotransferase family protein [Sesbania bispinosa]